MKILVISDIHNDVENVLNYIDKISMLDFDAVVALGDFVDYNVPRGFKPVDVGKIILEELKSIGKPVYAVPGNFDKELIPLFEKEGVSLHGRGVDIKGVGLYGFGGATTPFESPYEPSETDIVDGLKDGYAQTKSAMKAQFTHMPPAGTNVDKIASGGHVGSKKIRDFIIDRKPVVAVSSHIHEARGIDELGPTKLLNPGRFSEGYCGLVTIEKENTSVKVINLI